MMQLKFEAVDQFYEQSHILRSLSFEVENGSCLALLGRNGEGKTTCLKALMGLLPIKRGRILFEDRDISHLKPEERAALGLGYVPQGRMIFPLLTVEENIRVGLALNHHSQRKIPDYVYDFFPVLKEMSSRRGGDLSGGQQQQLAIARALVTDPKILILDEPTEGIQPNIVSQIADVIRRLNAELNLTVLLVEQKLPFAKKAASHYAVLERGSIAASGLMSTLQPEIVERYLKV